MPYPTLKEHDNTLPLATQNALVSVVQQPEQQRNTWLLFAFKSQSLLSSVYATPLQCGGEQQIIKVGSTSRTLIVTQKKVEHSALPPFPLWENKE